MRVPSSKTDRRTDGHAADQQAGVFLQPNPIHMRHNSLFFLCVCARSQYPIRAQLWSLPSHEIKPQQVRKSEAERLEDGRLDLSAAAAAAAESIMFVLQ